MHEHHAIVPNADRTALLVSDGQLPVVRLEERRLQTLLEVLELEHGVRAPYLRTVRRAEDESKGLKTLYELDAAPADWAPRPAAEWLSLDQVNAAALAPDGFADGLDEWLSEQRGAPVPERRSPWARPGWLAEASRWVSAQVETRGEAELVRQWPLSSVLRFDTEDGALYLKAVFRLFRQEPAITHALAREHPGLVPDVVALDRERGWFLMRELGSELAGDGGLHSWAEAFRTAASIQRAWVGRAAELAALGAPDRGLHSLETYAELERIPMPVAELSARLSRYGIPETIVHGDLHPWNAVIDSGRAVVFDWSDAAISHPFLDLGAALFHAGDDDLRATVVDAYLEPWSGLASQEELRAAAALGEVLGCIYQAVSYQAINDALEPSESWLFAGEWQRWKRRAAELAERL